MNNAIMMSESMIEVSKLCVCVCVCVCLCVCMCVYCVCMCALPAF